jgi:hypothetical protein
MWNPHQRQQPDVMVEGAEEHQTGVDDEELGPW